MQTQTYVTEWLLDHPGQKLLIGGTNRSCELACALVNLGIAEIEGNHIKLLSPVRARQFLGRAYT